MKKKKAIPKNFLPKIDVGSEVMLKRKYIPRGGYRMRTRVKGWIRGIEGGVELFDALQGSRGWNVEHLELYVKPKRLFPTKRVAKR